MLDQIKDVLDQVLAGAVLTHLFTVAGFLLAFFLVARLMSEKRAPANTFAWLLVIVLVPWFGVPLYLLLGGRKLRRLAKRKSHLHPTLPGAARQAPAFLDTPVAHALVSAGASPPVAGNCFEVLSTGEEEFAVLERQILAAKHTIHITTFILSRDATGQRIVALLAQRAREGVKVRLLLDALGCLFSSRGFVDPIRKAGGEVGRFMPVLPFTSRSSANLRSHRKISIFDHTTAILGGRNLAHEYMGPKPHKKRWRDFGAIVTGPAAALLNDVFIADWCFATRASPAMLRAEIPTDAVQPCGNAELQVVASGPDMPGDPLYEGIIAMIQEATESICIVTPYFIPDEVLLRSLIVKARAGREVTLVVPGRSNHPITDFARRHFVRELVKAGGRVLHYHGMNHSKLLIVDERIALMGSPNFDVRSLFVNFEIGLVIHSPAQVADIKAWATALMAQCSIPPRTYRRQHRILGPVVEEISRLLAPLL